MKLRKEALLALTAVVRADGVLAPEEHAALVAAAEAAGLDADGMAAVADALGGRAAPPPSTWAAPLELEERLFVYVAAVWLAGVDGVVAAEETATLARLAGDLGLSEGECTIGALAAAGLSAPGSRDVLALARAISEHGND